MLGVVSQTRLSGEPHAINLAHYPLHYHSTLYFKIVSLLVFKIQKKKLQKFLNTAQFFRAFSLSGKVELEFYLWYAVSFGANCMLLCNKFKSDHK